MLDQYVIEYQIDGESFFYLAWAEDEEHAKEQFRDAEPEMKISRVIPQGVFIE